MYSNEKIKQNQQDQEMDQKNIPASADTINRLAAIGEISAGIAHEIKNPLTAVKGFIQLMQKDLEHQYLDIAAQELENALDTLNNLLQVSRPQMQDEPLTKIKLSSELEAIANLFQDQQYRVKVFTSFQDTRYSILGKRNVIKKAFFNLIKNAFEAIEEAGSITIRHVVENSSIKVQIEDTGVGIPEEKLDLLGTPFFSTKQEGTGMGLTLVYTSFYEHGADIEVKSEVGKGTCFTIRFPIINIDSIEVNKLGELQYQEGQSFNQFVVHNQKLLEEMLTRKINLMDDKLSNNDLYSQESLLKIAHQLISYLHSDDEHHMITLAKTTGVTWAKTDIPASLKLEWFRGFREVYWDFLYNYYQNVEFNKELFFTLEKRTNYLFDTFLNQFFTAYNEQKSEILRSQREVIEELSVPIIPLSQSVAILPVLGTLDTYRAKKIQESTLIQVRNRKAKKLIIDLSGVAYMDTAVVGHLFRIVDGLNLLGCQAVVTGIRAEIANTVIEMGININDRILTYGDLEQAIEELNIVKNDMLAK